MKPAKKLIEPLKEKLIGEVLVDLCRNDLDKLAKAGIPTMALITMILRAKAGDTVMSEESKEAFRQRGEDAKQFSANIEALALKGRAFVGAPQYLNLLADSMRKNSIGIGQWLRKHGRKDDRNGCDQGIVMLLRGILRYKDERGILRYKEGFNCWAELQRVIQTVYMAKVGGGRRAVDGVSAGALSKVAGGIRREMLNGKRRT